MALKQNLKGKKGAQGAKNDETESNDRTQVDDDVAYFKEEVGEDPDPGTSLP